MSFRSWSKTPKGYVVIVMVAFLCIASIFSHTGKGIVNGLVAVGISAALDMLCARLAKRKRVAPDGAVITGLIIALILSVTTPWYMVAATAILAILSKHLLVYKKKPIFNPAAVGLLLSILLFQTGQSWWGAFGDLPAWTIALLFIGGYAVTNRVNKFPQVFSFLGTYFIILLVMGICGFGDASDALRSPFINAALFFALFMLTDTPTSPAKDRDQIVFGILSAVVGAAVYSLFGGLMYLFIGLLVGNLFHFIKSRQSSSAAKLRERSYHRA